MIRTLPFSFNPLDLFTAILLLTGALLTVGCASQPRLATSQLSPSSSSSSPSTATTTTQPVTDAKRWAQLMAHLQTPPPLTTDGTQPGPFTQRIPFKDGKLSYQVLVHSPLTPALLTEVGTNVGIRAVRERLAPSLEIPVDSRGMVAAANRMITSGEADPTNYDAVWVRDSLWAYLGLSDRPESLPQARRVLRAMSAYFASPAQLKRLQAVIASPAVIMGTDGSMNTLHIRFNGKDPEFADVQVDGRPQQWNHKQNDAIGLFYDLMLRAVRDGEIAENDLSPEEWRVLASLPAYFAAIKFDSMEDAGAWEEIERTNTSSIALVTSALENLHGLLLSKKAKDTSIRERLRKAAPGMQERGYLENGGRVLKLIDAGYDRIFRQLAAGGESPLYPKRLRTNSPQENARYRTADAALLNLIFPARLSRLDGARMKKILRIVETLAGEAGIKRYARDSYQSGNFWFQTQQSSEQKTADTSSASDFINRASGFISDSEAQWFFDSWYSVAAGIVAAKTGDESYRFVQRKYLRRAIGQMTGGTKENPVLGADGRPVYPNAFPESYNTIQIADHRRFFVPSPITPLNWAKASLRLALKADSTNGP